MFPLEPRKATFARSAVDLPTRLPVKDRFHTAQGIWCKIQGQIWLHCSLGDLQVSVQVTPPLWIKHDP